MIQRGEIWWAHLAPPRGSEPGYRRPVLVVQANSFNRSRIQTVIVVVISSNTSLTESPGNVFLSRTESRLPKDSVANVSQVVTLDKSFLLERVGTLPSSLFDKVEVGLRLAMSL